MAAATMAVRRVVLRVVGVPWMEHYHGAEAKLIGERVDALELTTADAVAWADDSDGEATRLWERWQALEGGVMEGLDGTEEDRQAAMAAAAPGAKGAFMDHVQRRFLQGHVLGVRT